MQRKSKGITEVRRQERGCYIVKALTTHDHVYRFTGDAGGRLKKGGL